MSYVYALLSAAAFGGGDFLGGLAARAIHWARVALIAQAAGFVMLLLIALLGETPASLNDIGWGVVAGLGSGIGVSLLYRALSTGQMGVVAPVTALCAIVLPALFSGITGKVPEATQVLGILLSLPALILISGELGAVSSKSNRNTRHSLYIALAAGVCIAAVYICLKQVSVESGLWPIVAMRAFSTLLCAGYQISNGKQTSAIKHKRRATLQAAGAGVVDGLANALFVLSVQSGDLAVVATLTSLYPAATILLARVILGERFARLQRIGLCLAVIAVVAIAYRA